MIQLAPPLVAGPEEFAEIARDRCAAPSKPPRADRRASAMAGDGGSSLRRGLLALEALALAEEHDDAGLGVVDVARRLGVDKSQASRTLRALADQGLAERDAASRAYRLGPRVFAYAALVSERRLLRAAPPVLARLVAALGERAHLSVLDGAAVLTLLSQSPPHAVQAAGWAGRSVPAYCTAAGRALLADHDPEALRALLGGRRPRRRAARTRSRRIAELEARVAGGRRGAATPSPTRSSSRGSPPSRRRCAASTAGSSPP